MSKVCQICGKGPTAGTTKSHSHVSSKRMVKKNLQNKKLDGKKMKVCTSCIKTHSKQSR